MNGENGPCAGFPESERPTLSVGLGIGHVLESMGDLLELGRRAEKRAKGADLPIRERRNALGVIVDKRSGGTVSWRAQCGKSRQNVFRKIGTCFAMFSQCEKSTRSGCLRRLPKPWNSGLDRAGLEFLKTRWLARSNERRAAQANSNLIPWGYTSIPNRHTKTGTTPSHNGSTAC